MLDAAARMWRSVPGSGPCPIYLKRRHLRAQPPLVGTVDADKQQNSRTCYLRPISTWRRVLSLGLACGSRSDSSSYRGCNVSNSGLLSLGSASPLWVATHAIISII